ncbi:hypothetical protein [Streptomyces sp. NBC_00057]|uniref:hypothetical protein n=1 Tax=Streptomyces sp. NBC_00057 TaxID=2975634 RepID=UPI002F917165
MQNNDKPNTQPELPSAAAKKPRLAPLRAWWNTAWDEGGALYAHWEDIRRARHAGWHGMAHWIKALLGLTGACAVIILLDTTADIVSAVARHLTDAAPTPATSSGFWAVVDNPVRTFIAQHTGAGLAVTAPAVYAAWQAAGLFGLVGGFFYSTGARITFTIWGCASVAMIWSATPADSRVVATGIAVLAWTAASALALRGLSLRPVVHNHNAAPVFQPEFRPELHIHATIPAPAGPGDDTPDNVRQLQQR